MKIVVITRERIETLPPVISMIEMLDDLGVNVQIIACGIADNIRNEFERRKIEYVQIDYCFLYFISNSLLLPSSKIKYGLLGKTYGLFFN